VSGRAEAAVQAALMAGLRGHAGVVAAFGDPARVYDDETRAPAFPYARIERHESVPTGTGDIEHKITLAVTSREGGLLDAKDALSAIRAAAEGMDWDVAGHHVVMAHVIYADTMRASDAESYRGLIRIRIISEEAA
tara:strand:- start:6699 stop:7106 length:408 start_codon:yes stop_codon:yes gene_type:complete